MSKLLGGNPSSKGTDKSALIASWCAAAGDKRMSVKPDKPSAPVDVDPAEKDEDDVSKFAQFAAEERKNIADLGLQVDESWILKEINRRWIAKHGSAPPDSSSAVTDTTSKPKMVPKAKVLKEEPKKEPSKDKVEMSDIELPDDLVESLGLVFVGKFRDKFMYRSKEEPKVEVKVEPKKKALMSKSALKKPVAPAVQSAISKRKSKSPVKASLKDSSPVRGSSSKAKKPQAKPVVTKQDADMAHWYNIASGRIYEKSSKDEKARAWVKEGLELFNASFDTPMGDDADEFEAAELARQFMMVTDDEAEDEEEEDADDADYVGGSADEDQEEEEEEEDNDDD
eukprot:353136-Prymnesium_polylepis.2